ncbi:uncharacterized protein BKA55DRAFT_734705 [Fusarium redolens]|uniref:Uncharacterized protein n=1 Tax=Fusarium redolens TaxID=48865 RepID=A0A9P9HY07_FUSRE|nr:uncharacterized protein BKA55DRAFT_734705 [Fusarium redolens]KAH7265426.1 hypothetical protein BKA55DRAFT_734705 [Fusarium redolens]
MPCWSPINAKQVAEKRAQVESNLFWKTAMRVETQYSESPEEVEEGYLQHCRDVKEKRRKEEEAVSQAETEAAAQAAVEPPAAGEKVEVEKVSRRGKVNNWRECLICTSRGKKGEGKKYNMSNFSDHIKVHKLEEGGGMGEQARHPCTSCKDARQCRVARRPQAIRTYACMCCLRAHKCCSFNIFKKGGNKCKDQVHPALLP